MKLAVGGMIASGKSTLTQEMARYFEMPLLEEFNKDDEVFNKLLTWLYEGKPNVEMLLQIYFINQHWASQKALGHHIIVDRHIIEHWIFAQVNLKKHPEILNMYNGLYHQYMNSIDHPDLYIILEMNWETFKKRIMKRGREQEIENFGRNKEYFKQLFENYTDKLISQCIIYDIPFYVLDTDDLSEEQVADAAIQVIEIFFKDEDITGKNERNLN
jgi:deoxyadenosine/deoxycytidine kinase